MDNQNLINSNIPSETTPAIQELGHINTKRSMLLSILVTLIISGIAFGVGGYYIGSRVINSDTASTKLRVEKDVDKPDSQNVSSTLTPTEGDTNPQKIYDRWGISFRYPSNLYVWSYGRGASLDYFQLNTEEENSDQINNNVVFAFDIQTLTYTENKSLDDQKAFIQSWRKLYPEDQITISNRVVGGVDSLVYDRTVTNPPSYSKTIWLINNNVKYIISMTIPHSTAQSRDKLKDKNMTLFESILDSIKFKYVDPAEVEKFGNRALP